MGMSSNVEWIWDDFKTNLYLNPITNPYALDQIEVHAKHSFFSKFATEYIFVITDY